MSDERVMAVVEEFIRTHPEADADECRRYAVHEVTLTRTPMGGGPQIIKVDLGIGPPGLAEFIRQNLND